MDSGAVIERVERINATRADALADRADLDTVLRDVTALRGWLAAVEADVARRLADVVSFPEAAIADTSRESSGKAAKTIERSKTLVAAPELADALDNGKVTASHVDAVTRAAAEFDSERRRELIERCDELVDVASAATVEQWGKRVRHEATKMRRDDGMDRLERQRRATSMSTWVDAEGMWNLRARFDPVTGVRLAARLDNTVEAMFAEQTPETCPSDPLAKQAHLRALALARLIEGGGTVSRPGRAEFVVVIDTGNDTANSRSRDPSAHASGEASSSRPDTVPLSSAGTTSSTGTTSGAGTTSGIGTTSDAGTTTDTGTTGESRSWDVTWPIPVEVPIRVLLEMMHDQSARTHPVIVRNGIVLHAPGELNLGRSTRLANRAQRRALRGLYATCAVHGCSVAYDRCKLHHIIWWRHGGCTDLDNLLPVCSKHHSRIHNDGWIIELGPHRELTVTLPDGTTMANGPPHRGAA